MDKTNVVLLGASAALVLALLTACGGGGSDPNAAEAPVAADQVPDEASASTADMAGWMTRLATAATEMLEPLDTSRFNPPTPDTTEPEAVN